LQSTNKEKKFRAEYEENEKYNLSTVSTNESAATESVTFFRPVKGVLAAAFNVPAKHYGVDIITDGESVVATLEGSVIYTAYAPELGGYVMQIQHKNGFVSIYKDVAMLLKKAGDKVKTGEAVGLMGNGDKNAEKKSLLFELWYKGNPVNPELYISF
jgi:murein DD-endopeptidase MepM/ murein hydrolase activator NlpD